MWLDWQGFEHDGPGTTKIDGKVLVPAVDARRLGIRGERRVFRVERHCPRPLARPPGELRASRAFESGDDHAIRIAQHDRGRICRVRLRLPVAARQK